ncbi:sugar ABC transporter ATP-binding protein [Trueperella sp. LYQ143]|uniref:sugar ABC transporter ATP-binding protein n=1 Tax=Trueperella sp. LYQ143 TaxID=3391059 RepID=UPI0039839761
MIRAQHITKTFPGVRALDTVDFAVSGGQIHALIGENGAGKSTLMKILGGIYQPDSGEVYLDGQPVHFSGPLDALASGIAVIHQELNLMPDLTVAQNIFFGRELGRGYINDAQMSRRSAEILERLDVDIDPDALVGSLTVAAQQMVEIAKALSMNARVLIMDEPTAAISSHEVEKLFAVVRDFINPDRAVIYISHRLEEIQELCTDITVLRDGKHVATHPAAELTREDMISLMVGRAIDTSQRPESTPSDQLGLEVTGLSAGFVRDVSVQVYRGEIFGLAGLVGAGRTEFARAVAGADPKDSGDIKVNGQPVITDTPTQAVQAGIGYLSEDRKQYGLLLEQDVVDNVALPSLDMWSNVAGVIDDSSAETVADRYTDMLAIRTPSVFQKTRLLSGGNQQKVVLAKWMARDCEVLLFDEPTRGVDIGAKDEIYRLMEDLAARGKTLVVISSEIAELQRVCHRIGVMCHGHLTGILRNEEATQEKIMNLATRFDVVSNEEESGTRKNKSNA